MYQDPTTFNVIFYQSNQQYTVRSVSQTAIINIVPSIKTKFRNLQINFILAKKENLP